MKNQKDLEGQYIPVDEWMELWWLLPSPYALQPGSDEDRAWAKPEVKGVAVCGIMINHLITGDKTQ